MTKNNTDIKQFESQLGENYLLVVQIWNDICQKDLIIQPFERLDKDDKPVDQCTELEKILLACMIHARSQEETIILTRVLLSTIYSNHKIENGSKIKIKGLFFIVIEQ